MIEIVDLDHAQELDAFVEAHPNCHFMQTSAWGRVKHDRQWCGILCRDTKGTVRGTMALLRHKLRYGKSSLLYAPRGPITDDGDKKTFTALIAAARELALDTGAYALRIDPRVHENDTEFLAMARDLGFSCNQATDFSLFQPRMGYVLTLEGLTPETLADCYHYSTQRNIRLAQRNGATVRKGGLNDLPQFCAMMEETARKNRFEPRNYDYFRDFLQEFEGSLYLAEHDGRIIAGAISVICGDRAWFMYSCSLQESLKLHPNELLQWHMQSDAIEAGCRYFDFRGVEGYPFADNPKLGLHLYKQRFGARFCAYIGQLDMTLRPVVAACLRAASYL